MDAPLPPPAYADGEHTDFVLIEKFGYVVDREDATTATCVLQGPDLKGSIKVTFCAACPPRVSYFCVHATEYGRADFDLDPAILATEGPLVLLSAMLPSPSDIFHRETKEYFVYHASTGGTEGEGKGKKEASRPSLKHLPNPGRHHEFEEASATLLRICSKHDSSSGSTLHPHGANQEDHDCEACEFVIAAKRSARVRRTQHELCLYHSEKEAWSIKTARVSGDAPYNHHWTDKAIAIGGDDGVVAWVNLGRDILFCDVLAETPTLCPVELPLLIPASKGVGSTGDPRCSRDVAIADGLVHYTQLQIRIVPGSFMEDGAVTFDGWKAAKCSMAIDARSLPLAEASWQHTGLELDSSQISVLMPNLVVDEGGTIAFERLHVGLPTLSLRDYDIVYFLAKIDYRDVEHTAYVLAVDLRNKTMKSVAEFGAKNTIGLGQAYIASTISKYLKVAPG